MQEDLERQRLQAQIQMRDAHFNELTGTGAKRMTLGRGLFQRKVTENDFAMRVQQAHDSYEQHLHACDQMRHDYFSQHLPTLLKESSYL